MPIDRATHINGDKIVERKPCRFAGMCDIKKESCYHSVMFNCPTARAIERNKEGYLDVHL